MPKVIIEFDPVEERYELDNALYGGRFRSALREIDNTLRNRIKYQNRSEEVNIAYSEIRSWIWEAFEGIEE